MLAPQPLQLVQTVFRLLELLRVELEIGSEAGGELCRLFAGELCGDELLVDRGEGIRVVEAGAGSLGQL